MDIKLKVKSRIKFLHVKKCNKGRSIYLKNYLENKLHTNNILLKDVYLTIVSFLLYLGQRVEHRLKGILEKKTRLRSC